MVSIINTPFEGEINNPFPYELDNFQKHSVHLIDTQSPCNILVTAHTGSGKSLVAEYAILKAIELGKKVIYCSPIKTLSNQKFYEFTHKYPTISTGIITGDNKHNPIADCLIMTTEILMLILEKRDIKINNIDYNINIEDEAFAIIFDEVHYINDVERGNVWEKSIMMIPKNISIIMLSATIDKPEYFLEWVHSCNGNKSFLLSNYKRVVPLKFSYLAFLNKIPKALQKYEDSLNNFVPIMDTETKKISENATNTFFALEKYFKDNRVNLKWLINHTCKFLSERQMCPALFFVFSKKTCFFLAESITEHFNTDEEARQVEKDILYYLSKLEHKEDYMKTVQYYQILDLAKKGIAVHHSGLIPVFKEIIEMLFSKNQIKILFATETFAVGLNMPTKTVIFTDIFKFDNNGKRILHSFEFTQMSGRAGRRGLDTVGHVILLPQVFSDSMTRLEFKNLLIGHPQTITSKFKIDGNMILDSMKRTFKLSEFVKRTMLSSELEKEKHCLDVKINASESKLGVYTSEDFKIFEELETINKRLSDLIQPSKQTKKILLARKKELESSDKFLIYKSQRDSLNCLSENKRNRQYIDEYLDIDIECKFKYLEESGYFENGELTLKGITGLCFKELDSIIGAELVFSEFINS